MIERIKNILTTPKTEWSTIAGEHRPHLAVFTTWVLILAAITFVAAIIGYGIIGVNVMGVHVANFGYGLRQAIVQYVSIAAGVYVTAWVIDLLAETFGAVRNFNQAFSLVAYAYTPAFLGGVFYLLPSLSWLSALCGIWSLYLLYVGLRPMMNVPDEKHLGYFVVSLLAMVAAFAVLSVVLGAILVTGAAVGI